jgi:hypothetical protein
MTAAYFLSNNAYMCVDRNYCIFLDVQTDKYLAVSRHEVDCLSPWLSGWSDPPMRSDSPIPTDIETMACDLLRIGILTTLPLHGKAFRPQGIQRPTASISASQARVHFHSALPLAAATAWSSYWANRRLSKYSLMATIQLIRDQRAGHPQSCRLDLRRASDLLDTFNRWHVLFSRPSACLFESLSLLRFLTIFRVFPSLVFGVMSEPFQAHCWLQHGGMVINDTVSRVTDFTPVMLV